VRNRAAAARPALLAGFLLAAAVIAPAAAAAETPIQVHAQLEPQVIGLDDTAVLTVTAESGGLSSLSFQPKFVLDNLEIAGGASQSEEVALMNGTLSRSYRYSLALRPMAIGPAHVRGIVLTVRGQLMRLPDQEVTVQEQPAGTAPGTGGTGAPGARRAGPPQGMPTPEDLFDQFFGGSRPSLGEAPRAQGPAAFLRAEVVPPKPLAGEQALYTVYLYTRQDVAGINFNAMPTFQGFWVRDLPLPERLVPETVIVGSERYVRVPIVRKALFALRPGPHTLEPAGCDVVVEPLTRSFFGPTLGRPEEIHLHTAAQALDVRPLPAPPPGFTGVIGSVSLTARLQPYTLLPGQAATLTVTLAGAGNLQGVTAPRLDLPPALTVFPPQQQSDDRLDGTTVKGRRIWTYVLIANRPGRYALRPHPITYFDPARREYRLAESPPLALAALAPLPAAPAHPGAPRAGRATPALDHPASLAGWWHWLRQAARRLDLGLVLAVAVLLAIVLLLSRRYRQISAPAGDLPGVPAMMNAPADLQGVPAMIDAPADLPGVPARVDAPADLQGLPASGNPPAGLAGLEAKLKEAAREDRPRHAAALVEDGWRGLLAARWGVPATTPPPRWGAALAAHGMPADLADEMLHLIEELHYLRYAPQLSTTSAVRDEVLSRSRRLLRRMR
jgi:hypothetical protein